MVRLLCQTSMKAGHKSAMASKTPSIEAQKSADQSMEERFHYLVDQLTSRSRQEDLTLTEFSSLTDELLEMTSILALFLRNGRKTTGVSRRFVEIEKSLTEIHAKLGKRIYSSSTFIRRSGNWDITPKNISVMQQQITIAQTLLQATQLLGKLYMAHLHANHLFAR